MKIWKIKNVKWLPFGWDGMALKWVIFFKDANPPQHLIDHEMWHVTQQYSYGLSVYLFKYIFSKQFRYQRELEAYLQGSGLSYYEAERMAKRYVE
jgi:hypothetical protein